MSTGWRDQDFHVLSWTTNHQEKERGVPDMAGGKRTAKEWGPLSCCPSGFRASPDPNLIPHWSAKVSALADWFLHLEPFPRARLVHRPHDGGSKDLWKVSKLLPHYTALQPRRQPSSLWRGVVLHAKSSFIRVKTVFHHLCSLLKMRTRNRLVEDLRPETQRELRLVYQLHVQW
jgi:hypothetical protein